MTLLTQRPKPIIVAFVAALCLAVLMAPLGPALAQGPEGSSAKPLYVAILWHQHQPSYMNPDTGVLDGPWVRMHGVNDYPFMAEILKQYPNVHVNFNLTPSLLMQIDEYLSKKNTDQYMRVTLKEKLTEEDKQFIRDHFGDINPQFVSAHPEFAALREKVNRGEALSDQEYIDARMYWNLYWMNIYYIENDPELKALMDKKTGYTMDDLRLVVKKHLDLMGRIIPLHRELLERGQADITTTPFYHPILPLLIKKGWPEDAKAQIDRAVAYYKKLFGRAPDGMWPSEGAVSIDVVPPAAAAGIRYIVTDAGILSKSGVNASDLKNLCRPYIVEKDGFQLVVFFRDTDLSNRISFKYSGMSAEAAVKDFMDRLHEIQKLNTEGDMILTIALDGENCWEYYRGNGNEFRHLLYKALSEDPLIKTVTFSEYLKLHPPTRRLSTLAEGSWAGDLTTWIGEPEEDEAWDRLAAAREALVSYASKPGADKKALARAWEALYQAEGSDWFWWYGTDKDAGNQMYAFDRTFKLALMAVYKAIGYKDDEIPAYLYTKYLPPAVPAKTVGWVMPAIDGAVSQDAEWDGAGFYQDVDAGAMLENPTDLIAGVYVGLDDVNIYLRIDRTQFMPKGDGAVVAVYASDPGGKPGNVFTRYQKPSLNADQVGFVIGNEFLIDLSKAGPDGKVPVVHSAADGMGGWTEVQTLNTAAAGDVIEVAIPRTALGVVPGKPLDMAVVASRDGAELDRAPSSGKISFRVPTAVLASGPVLFEMTDPVGDDHGPGSYTYPTNAQFEPFKGLFDLTSFKVMDGGKDVIFQLVFAEMTNPWNSPLGFSHPIINIYISQGREGGKTATHAEGAFVRFDPKHPWHFMVKAAGWPEYGQVVYGADGSEHKAGVVVQGNPAAKTVNIFVSKDIIGDPKDKAWGYYVLIGSQDGYGPDHFRPVVEKSGEWTIGGGSELNIEPNVMDLLAPAEGRYTQEKQLGSYDLEKMTLATVYPVGVELEGGFLEAPALWAAAGVMLLAAGAVVVYLAFFRKVGIRTKRA